MAWPCSPLTRILTRMETALTSRLPAKDGSRRRLSASHRTDALLSEGVMALDQVPPGARKTIQEQIGDGKILEIDGASIRNRESPTLCAMKSRSRRKAGREFDFSVGPQRQDSSAWTIEAPNRHCPGGLAPPHNIFFINLRLHHGLNIAVFRITARHFKKTRGGLGQRNVFIKHRDWPRRVAGHNFNRKIFQVRGVPNGGVALVCRPCR